MAEGFEVFAPYRHVRKVTMFGSARTLPTDPLYAQARDLAALLAPHGWSTVTGAGPGIMAAGLEGAGPDHAFGINIRLPFEQGANEFIAENPRLVSMKYFFTRKLLLIKESFGYAVLPGGFGTLDEAFELLTLIQTGKAEPAPVVLLDLPGQQLLEGVGALRHRRGGHPPPDQPRRRQPVPHRRPGRGRRRRDPRLLPQLSLAALGRRHPGHPAGIPPDRDGGRRPVGAVRRRPPSPDPRPGRPAARRTTQRGLPGPGPAWPSDSTASPTPGCASSSTPSTPCRARRRPRSWEPLPDRPVPSLTDRSRRIGGTGWRPSRVVFGPHETNLARGRAIGARHVAYYARRAAGGAGVIIIETASVSADDWPYERAPLAADCGPGWRAVAEACRPHGPLVLAGLGHAGGQGSSAYSQAVMWAPSRVADVVSREPPAALEPAGIAAIVAAFAEAARLAVVAGLDGVEVDAGAWSLLRQFHSGLTNLRADGYGRGQAAPDPGGAGRGARRHRARPDPGPAALLRRAGPVGRGHPGARPPSRSPAWPRPSTC